MDKYENFESKIKALRDKNEFCSLQHVVPLDGSHVLCEERKMLNFCSNDYLGLSQHADLKKNAIKYLLQYGVGSTSSTVSNGHLECNRLVEEKLAQLLGIEAVHFFNSRFQANMTVIPTLASSDSQIFIDGACHKGLFQGAAYSRAEVKTYDHNDLFQLEELLENSLDRPAFTKLIIVESLFSLEGDTADLSTLSELANHYQALLCVDDSHAVGVMGHHGMGLAANRKGIDVVIGTFSKACGTVGAYVGCNQLLKDYLINFCPGLRDCSLPPSILGAIEAALDILPQMEGERKRLEQRAYWLRKQFQEQGLSIGTSTSHIIPLMIGGEDEMVLLLKTLADADILATPIKHPLVPKGTARLRFTVNSLHTPDDLNQLSLIFQACAAPFAFVTQSLTETP